jgi:hypothetical protein
MNVRAIFTLLIGASAVLLGAEACSASGDDDGTSSSGGPACECAAGEYCDAVDNQCKACACEPGAETTCTDGLSIETCRDDCSGVEALPCGPGRRCDGAANQCVQQVCSPGSDVCIDDTSFHACNTDGSDFEATQQCTGRDTCSNGQCIDPCTLAESVESNVGCEFWAVDMPNLPPRDSYVFSIAVSNPSQSSSANINVYDSRMGSEQVVTTGTVGPREVQLFNLSGSNNGQVGAYPGDAGFLGSGIGQGNGFRIESDIPIVAVQFNPIGGASGFTTDASLLLPTHTITTDYIHLAFAQGFGDGSTLDVVGTQDGTTVTITPSVNTSAGQNGLPAMTAGQPTAVTINRYDYIQITTGSQDLSGTSIVATAPVAVFGGHTCANVPTTSTTACDHVEEQIFPLSTWGTHYIAARNPIRNAEPMLWRIVGSVDNTTVNFEPASTLGASATINRGQVLEFQEQSDFSIDATQPILVAGYMLGCSSTGGIPGCPGDPYMVLMVPVEQYQSDYVFLVDSSYDADFAKLVRPTGAQIDLACFGVIPEERWTPVGASGFDVATIDMNPGEAMCMPGTNEATGNQAFGIIVSGQSSAASYGYPGGLRLEEINIPK